MGEFLILLEREKFPAEAFRVSYSAWGVFKLCPNPLFHPERPFDRLRKSFWLIHHYWWISIPMSDQRLYESPGSPRVWRHLGKSRETRCLLETLNNTRSFVCLFFVVAIFGCAWEECQKFDITTFGCCKEPEKHSKGVDQFRQIKLGGGRRFFINRSIDQSINQSINQSLNQSVSEWESKRVSE